MFLEGSRFVHGVGCPDWNGPPLPAGLPDRKSLAGHCGERASQTICLFSPPISQQNVPGWFQAGVTFVQPLTAIILRCRRI